MASATLTEQGDCLRDLGRLSEAAARYEEAITVDEARGDMRDVAVGTGQLGTVRMLQQRYANALTAWDETRRLPPLPPHPTHTKRRQHVHESNG
jgi:tetratricopeptide (TPR) repeat protein